jgi:hypothetical protein
VYGWVLEIARSGRDGRAEVKNWNGMGKLEGLFLRRGRWSEKMGEGIDKLLGGGE